MTDLWLVSGTVKIPALCSMLLIVLCTSVFVALKAFVFLPHRYFDSNGFRQIHETIWEHIHTVFLCQVHWVRRKQSAAYQVSGVFFSATATSVITVLFWNPSIDENDFTCKRVLRGGIEKGLFMRALHLFLNEQNQTLHLFNVQVKNANNEVVVKMLLLFILSDFKTEKLLQ